MSKAIKGEKEEDETEPDSSAENGERKVKRKLRFALFIVTDPLIFKIALPMRK